MGYFCPECGAELALGQKSCPCCGARLSDIQIQPSDAERSSLTGTAFIEKAKGWASPQRKERRLGFAMLATLLLFSFCIVAGLLCVHLLGAFADQGAESAQALPEGVAQSECEMEKIDAANSARVLTAEEEIGRAHV